MASTKQVSYICDLALKAGYGRYLSAKLRAELPRDISFSSREAAKYQTVEKWAASLSTAQASAVISWLQGKVARAS